VLSPQRYSLSAQQAGIILDFRDMTLNVQQANILDVRHMALNVQQANILDFWYVALSVQHAANRVCFQAYLLSV